MASLPEEHDPAAAEQDERWMRAALEQAALAAGLAEVPVGAVVVRGGALVAAGHNLTHTLQDPSAHAEMVAIRRAAQALGHWRLLDCTLYVTLEPCAMCAGAIVLARIPRLVFAAHDPKAGMVGSLDNLAQHPRLNHRVTLATGVLAGEAGEMLRDFFRARRRGAPRRRVDASPRTAYLCASRTPVPATPGPHPMPHPERRILMDPDQVGRVLARMAGEIVGETGGEGLVLVGIERRGVQLADLIAGRIEADGGERPLTGSLDITLYRDDLMSVGPRPVVGQTRLPTGGIDGRPLVIVDDVLYTGRTVRAALDELADFGRPARILLAVLVDRGGRELPIQADVVGERVEVGGGETVEVLVPELDGRLGVDLVRVEDRG